MKKCNRRFFRVVAFFSYALASELDLPEKEKKKCSSTFLWLKSAFELILRNREPAPEGRD